jgi:hypothetical protein
VTTKATDTCAVLPDLVPAAEVQRGFGLTGKALRRLVRERRFPQPLVRLTTRRLYWSKSQLATLTRGR